VRIGVLTFHRCINYGSYWQARCLVEGLRAAGHDAVLLDHDDPGVRRREWDCAFQPGLPERTRAEDIRPLGRKTRKFLEAFETLPQSPRFPLGAPWQAGRYDAVVVGSDEVWNFSHPWYAWQPIFFGDGLNTDRLVSYAASFGNHDADRGINPDWASKIAKFSAVSVRDENSRRLVVEAGLGEPAIVLDPCLQFPLPPAPVESVRDPYLALYGHGLPDWFARLIRDHATARGQRIVSIGYRNSWADEQLLDLGPDDFPAVMAGAAAVATNFFHGCVFALHYGRPFVSAPSAYRFNKVRDLTAKLHAARHVVQEGATAGDIADLLDHPIAPAVGERIVTLRESSARFLADALG